MYIVGLTGGMGMGKTTIATLLRRAGWPIFDADAEVLRLQSESAPVLSAIESLVSGVVRDGVLDRLALRQAVVNNPPLLRHLEKIIHPQVRSSCLRFIAQCRRVGAQVIVLDIPLLFETGGQNLCHCAVVASAPRWVQVRRVEMRKRMPLAEAKKFIARQMPDARRRLMADDIIQTGGSLYETQKQVRQFIRRIKTHKEAKKHDMFCFI